MRFLSLLDSLRSHLNDRQKTLKLQTNDSSCTIEKFSPFKCKTIAQINNNFQKLKEKIIIQKPHPKIIAFVLDI